MCHVGKLSLKNRRLFCGVVPHNLGVRTLEFLDDLKALVELGEDIHHGAGEQGML